MIRRPTRSTRTDTLLPYTTLVHARYAARADRPARRRRVRGYGEQSAPAHPAGDRGARADLRQIGADPRHARRPAGARVDRRIREAPQPGAHPDRTSVVAGKRVAVRVDLGGRALIKKKNIKKKTPTT